MLNMVRATDENKDRIRKEGNVLFNDALNTFYFRLYDVGTTEYIPLCNNNRF